MADITGQMSVVYQDGKCGTSALIAVKGANAGDTVNVGAFFRVVKLAGLVSATGTTIAQLTPSGTVLTMPTGPSGDAVWLIVVGVAF